MALKMLVKAVDYNTAEWDCVPARGEVFVIKRPEVGENYVKIGNGKTRLGDLPLILNGQEEKMEQHSVKETCANCYHLCVINRNKIYAVCDEKGKVFELWRMDTRDSDACDKFVPKEVTLLKCPYCHKPMRWICGNPIFTYWDCDHCNMSFEYDVWTETFHDEKKTL